MDISGGSEGLQDLSADEILKNLQSFGTTRNIPAILLISGSTDLKNLTSFRPGKDQILKKPFTLQALTKTLSRVVADKPRAGKV